MDYATNTDRDIEWKRLLWFPLKYWNEEVKEQCKREEWLTMICKTKAVAFRMQEMTLVVVENSPNNNNYRYGSSRYRNALDLKNVYTEILSHYLTK